ncbi:MAG: hypothetical protein DIU78_000450 [Pseudomonadota bacterium]
MRLFSDDSSASTCARATAPDVTSARERFAEISARARRARVEPSCARSTLVSSSSSTCPRFTIAPESKWSFVTTPGTSLPSTTPWAETTLPTAVMVRSHVCRSAAAAPMASGGGPAFSISAP